MNQNILLIQSSIRIVWRYRWAALGGAMLICIAGWAAVIQMPNQYKSSAKVFMDTNSMLRPLLKGIAIDTGTREQIARMAQRTLVIRPNLEAVARETDMHIRAETPEQFEAALQRLGRKIQVKGTSRDNIFEIRYVAPDPDEATRVVESLLDIYVEKSLGESRRDTTQTKAFLERQIAEYEKKLQAAENRLKEFKQRHVGLMPGQGEDYYDLLEQVNEQLGAARLKLEEARNRRDELQRQLAEQSPGRAVERSVMRGAAVDPLEERIRDLESSLDSLLLRYTERHPEVTATRRILEELKRQQADAAAAEGQSAGELPTNPVYQELRVAFGRAQAEVAALEARVKEYARRKRELESLVDTIPEVEAQLVRLNRDYDVHQRNYEELVSRRESLELSDEASQTTDEVQFRIVEPPRRPVLPVGPDRLKLNVGVFVLGTGGGLGLAWLLAMWRPTIYTRRELADLTGLPVLGSVSRVWTAKLRMRRRVEVTTFGFGCLALLALFAVVVVLQPGGEQVMASLEALRGKLL
ncbi:MAG: chain length-determining protein [Gammaproteobacteria bacterium]|nr:chain length-determining protein [Gammaproteobacteria bacterium]NIR84448.1 chain length-determining protein [Gammaproteobacteria bacterium]NIR90929.1 chain length-determining protein [Gammaproteobacteria bacterium]NIU07115.1 chain length-determining protein [Gammaproteobacteria bacterium]NIV76244.1 chain length-determining protein [Gammaproteobacteria bacterium]